MKLRRPSHTTVVAYLALILVIGGGGAYAAGLGKNTVGTKQLKKNAVTTAKIKNGAITAAKVKAGTLTAAQIDVSQLGTVPSAQAAQTAKTAQAAQVADTVAPSEAWHEVGAPGEPGFLSDYKNAPPSAFGAETVGFYKDREGVVHLKGLAFSPTEEEPIFLLPPGYRPASGRFLNFTVPCSCPESKPGSLLVIGSNSVDPSFDGAVVFQNGSAALLDSVTFRAES